MLLVLASENITDCFSYVNVVAVSQSYSVNVYATPNTAPSEKCLSAYDGPSRFELVFDGAFKITSQVFQFKFSAVSQNVPYTTLVSAAEFATMATYRTAACNFVFLGDKLAPFYVQRFEVVVENNTNCWDSVSVAYDTDQILVRVTPLQCDVPQQRVSFSLIYGALDDQHTMTQEIASFKLQDTTSFTFAKAQYDQEHAELVEYFRQNRDKGARIELRFESNPLDMTQSISQELSAEVLHVELLGSEACNSGLRATIYFNEQSLTVQADFAMFDACYVDPDEKPDLRIQVVFQGTLYQTTVMFNAIRGTFGVSFPGQFDLYGNTKIDAYLNVFATRSVDEITTKEDMLAEFSAHGRAVSGCIVRLYCLIGRDSVKAIVFSSQNAECSSTILKSEIHLRISIISENGAEIAFHFVKHDVEMLYGLPFFELEFMCDENELDDDCKQIFKRLQRSLHKRQERNAALFDEQNEYIIQKHVDSQSTFYVWIWFACAAAGVLVVAGAAVAIFFKAFRM